MFDVGFWELLLVGLVALLAFGPNELPRLVRDTVRVMRRLRAAATAAGDELRRELRLDELDQMPRPGSSLGPIKGVVDEVRHKSAGEPICTAEPPEGGRAGIARHELAHEVRPPAAFPPAADAAVPDPHDSAAEGDEGEGSADNKASPISAVSQNDEHA